jgi:hypothetical protein
MTRVCPVALCLLVLFAIPVLEAGRISSKHGPTPVPTHPETVISAVTASAVTVTVQTVSDKGGKVLDKTSRAYAVTKFTEINVNGQRASIADLKPGMKVTVTIGADSSQAARIVANG